MADRNTLRADALLRALQHEDISIVASDLGLTVEEVEATLVASGATGALYVYERRLAKIRAAIFRIIDGGQEREIDARRRQEVELRTLREMEKELEDKCARLNRSSMRMHQAVPRG